MFYLRECRRLTIKEVAKCLGYEDTRKIRHRIDKLCNQRLIIKDGVYNTEFCPVSEASMRKHIVSGFDEIKNEFFEV